MSWVIPTGGRTGRGRCGSPARAVLLRCATMPVPTPPAEVEVTPALVRRLLASQHPDLAQLPLRHLGTGWDTVVHRLGRELTVRVPRRELGARLLANELRWLPELAPRLPWPVPEPVRVGSPSGLYPWPWSVCRYVPGRPVAAAGLAGEVSGQQLADFLRALHMPAPAHAPSSPHRGVPLAQRDDAVRAALTHVPPTERGVLHELWTAALDLPSHAGAPLWVHGDLHPLNLLAARDRISGVVDFGDLCAGDPATDLAAGWTVLDRAGRRRLRAAYAGPPDRWERGRGWAAFFAVMFLAHSQDDPRNAAIGLRTLAALREDAGHPASAPSSVRSSAGPEGLA